MVPVVLVIVIAVAWMVILGPSLVKRRSRFTDGISSISHFHRQLRVLEHSAPPPIVAPAYRLRGLDGSGELLEGPSSREAAPLPVLTVVGADQLPRPALAFLGAQPGDPSNEGGANGEYLPGPHYPPGSPLDASRARVTGIPSAGADSPSRHLVRRRRRDTLGILIAVFVASGMIGMVPGASMAWSVTALAGAALVAYVALLVHLRKMAEEREHKLHYLRPDAARGLEAVGRAGASYPVSGRYAHPSNQAAAAH
jgi:hypothetical protein